jgi:hypothetical protein
MTRSDLHDSQRSRIALHGSSEAGGEKSQCPRPGLGSDNVHSLAGGSIVGRVRMVPEPDFACFQRYTRTPRCL